MRYTLLIIFLLSNIALASIGTVSSFKGSVQIQRDSQNLKALLGLKIEKNDIINTKNNSNIVIKFNDNTIITVGKDSILSIEEYIYDKNNTKNSKTSFNFLKGTFKSVTGVIGKIHPEKFKLRTKTANIGIRGTVIIANQEIVACTSGSIQVSNENKTLSLIKNQYTKTDQDDTLGTALILNNEILDILYSGLAIDTYNKLGSDENSKIILLKKTLKKASEDIRKVGSGETSENNAGNNGDPGP